MFTDDRIPAVRTRHCALRAALCALAVVLSALHARAATFLVPDDRDLVLGSKAVVLAAAGASHAQLAPGGWIETVTRMTVEESIRGPLAAGDSFDVTELGGWAGDRGYAVPGAPRYAAGERLLLFLETNGRGEWTSKNMVLGRFSFGRDASGRETLERDAREIAGWDYAGAPHREPLRLAAPFLDYVRAVARGEEGAIAYTEPVSARRAASAGAVAEASPSVTSYLIDGSGPSGTLGIRWKKFPTPVLFQSHGSQPGAVNGGLSAAQKGIDTWTNDSASNVVYVYIGTTSTSNGLNTADGNNTIQFNDPAGEIPGAFTGIGGDTLAIGGAWFGSATHQFAGEQFYTIQEADLVVQNGITGSGLTGKGFDHVLTHELGHTLGIRHSDDPPAGGSSSFTALMSSSVDFNNDPIGSTLQAWDREAVAAIYGSGTPQCTPPSITVQPKSVALAGDNVVLSVTATGSTPLQYQWYVGQKGSTAQIVNGGTTPQIAVKPSVTTSYWVRVSNGCTPAADSDAAVVTVNGCPAVLINSLSPSPTILEGRSATLTVSASGGNSVVSYQWYFGAPGDTSAPVSGATGASLTVTPSVTTSYWVRVANACGASALSDAVIVTVTPCTAPKIVVAPSGGTFVAGDSVTLSATILGTAPLLVQWVRDGVAIPNATSSTVTVGPLFAAATFAVRASNSCGEVESAAVSYTLVGACAAPAIVQQPADTNVAAGSAAVVQVTSTGTSLTYAWYEGQFLDFTKPVGGSAPQLYTGTITVSKQYWVRVRNSCGTADSRTVTVNVVPTRRRIAGK